MQTLACGHILDTLRWMTTRRARPAPPPPPPPPPPPCGGRAMAPKRARRAAATAAGGDGEGTGAAVPDEADVARMRERILALVRARGPAKSC